MPRDRELQCLRRAAHREQEAAALHEGAQPLGDILLEPRYAGVAESLGRGGILRHHLTEPGRVTVAQMKFVELAREVLVVQMHPVVLREVALLNLIVIDRREIDARILEGERHGIVPGLCLERRIDGDARRFLQWHALHVSRRHLPPDRAQLLVRDRLHRDAVERRAATQLRQIWQEERATSIVEEPLRLLAGLHQVVRQAVRLQVIPLRVVHRDEQPLCGRAAHRAEREHERKEGASEVKQ